MNLTSDSQDILDQFEIDINSFAQKCKLSETNIDQLFSDETFAIEINNGKKYLTYKDLTLSAFMKHNIDINKVGFVGLQRHNGSPAVRLVAVLKNGNYFGSIISSGL